MFLQAILLTFHPKYAGRTLPESDLIIHPELNDLYDLKTADLEDPEEPEKHLGYLRREESLFSEFKRMFSYDEHDLK